MEWSGGFQSAIRLPSNPLTGLRGEGLTLFVAFRTRTGRIARRIARVVCLEVVSEARSRAVRGSPEVVRILLPPPLSAVAAIAAPVLPVRVDLRALWRPDLSA